MKPKGRHPQKSLSAVKLRTIIKPGRYADGNGLYLIVEASGAKRWMLRTVVHGRRRDIGLGSARLVDLATARDLALQFRKLARDGADPLLERTKARTVIPTFQEAAERVHEEHSAAWKNAKHKDQWINTLTQYVFPFIGQQRVDRIETKDILQVLSPIWLEKPETARRIKQRLNTVLDWAIASGFRPSGSPVQSIARGLPKQSGNGKSHYAALPYEDVPNFMCKLKASSVGEPVQLAFELLILTAARTSELLNAEWSEFDLDNRAWSVPAERMKAGRVHRVPLSSRTTEILSRAKELAANSPFVFPGRSGAQPLSNMVFLMAIRRMGLRITAHGFRSCFSDWAAERTNYSGEVREMALAHMIKNKAEAAYRRGDLFEKRSQLMNDWAHYCCRGAT